MLVHPRRFFRDGVAPGDQAPGLLFAIFVALVYQSLQFAVSPATIPTIEGGPVASAVVALLVIALFVAPALLHLTAAIQTALLIPLLSERAGVSETVQVIAYATAPCAFAAVPIPKLLTAGFEIPGIRAVCAAYGAVLLVIGISEVHQTSVPKAILASFVPAGVIFGYAFRGFEAFSTTVSVLATALT
ncbi:YIP1 family protein [Haloferax mucosum]|uniref:YIP1 family protein n=1 Tax=Haloferax mucosum TaxID=403181 RepID=UPI001F4CC760|nr:YIP1 family protein [Haloferax mucosum]